MDPAALANLLQDNRARLGRTLRLHLGPALARRVSEDDALHETFLAAQDRLAHAAGWDNPYLWLRTVAIQTACDLRRRHLGAQARDVRREQADAASAASALIDRLPHSATSPSGTLRKREALSQLERALATLSEADREVLVLRHSEDLTNQEVAAALSLSEKAANMRYLRALTRLRAACTDLGLSEGDVHGR